MSWLSDLFEPTKTGGGMQEIPLTPDQQKAIQFLQGLMTGGTPDFPTREIAGLTPQAKGFLGDYMGADLPESFTKARGALMGMVGEPVDITQLPEFKSIISTVRKEGESAVNQVLRRFQVGGMGASTPQGKAVGREVSHTLKNITGQLAPYAESERARRFGAIPLLGQFAEYEEGAPVRKLGVSERYETGYSQRQKDAEFAAIMLKMMFPFQTQAPIAGQLLGQQRYLYEQPAYGPSTFSQFAGAGAQGIGAYAALA